jgi:hypothetical protein
VGVSGGAQPAEKKCVLEVGVSGGAQPAGKKCVLEELGEGASCCAQGFPANMCGPAELLSISKRPSLD